MGKLSKVLGMDVDMEEAPADSESVPMLEEPEAKKSASAEVLAMKQFERASTPEAKVQAMKDFLESCGLY